MPPPVVSPLGCKPPQNPLQSCISPGLINGILRYTVNVSVSIYCEWVCVWIKEFKGNWNRHGVVKNVLRPHISSRYIRLYPRKYQDFGCLRLEFYGCVAGTLHSLAFKLNLNNGDRGNSGNSRILAIGTIQWSSLPFCLPSFIVQWPARTFHF